MKKISLLICLSFFFFSCEKDKQAELVAEKTNSARSLSMADVVRLNKVESLMSTQAVQTKTTKLDFLKLALGCLTTTEFSGITMG